MPGQLAPLSINMPSFKGLNTELENSVVSPEWASTLDNVVFDKTGRLAARKGWKKVHAVEETGRVFRAIHPYGTSFANNVVSHAGDKFLLGTSTLTDISGSTSPLATEHWQFVNFHDTCLSFAQGRDPIKYTGGGSFTTLTTTIGGSMPTTWGGVALVAYGRVWTIDATKTVIKYCGLLDETNWDVPAVSLSDDNAGIIDLTSVWKGGYDEITAISAFNGQLVIFCNNSVIVYANPWQPTTGMSLVENMTGIGCIARDSVATVGKDLWFLSSSGVRSLGRTLVQDKMPIGDISKNVRTSLISTALSTSDKGSIKSVYSEKEGFYLLSFPSAGVVYCFDIKMQLEDGAYRVSTWTGNVPTALTNMPNSTLYMGQNGYLSKYAGHLDNASTYTLTFNSGWFSTSQSNQYNILKKIKLYFYSGDDVSITTSWRFDFNLTSSTQAKTIDVQGVGSEYGIGEYRIAEYGGSNEWVVLNVPAGGHGTFFQYGISAVINDFELAFQKIDLFTKLGRIN